MEEGGGRAKELELELREGQGELEAVCRKLRVRVEECGELKQKYSIS